MIVSAAVKIIRPGQDTIVLPVHRHKDCSTIMQFFGYEAGTYAYQEGFLTDEDVFLDRAEAAEHVYESEQLIEDAETGRIHILMSEDLW